MKITYITINYSVSASLDEKILFDIKKVTPKTKIVSWVDWNELHKNAPIFENYLNNLCSTHSRDVDLSFNHLEIVN